MRDVELIQYSITQMLHKIVYRLWVVVKTGTCRETACSGTREAEHVFEIDRVVGSLARHDDELAALLETNVCGAVNEIGPAPDAIAPIVAMEHGTMITACLFRAGRRLCREVIETPVAISFDDASSRAIH